MSPPRCVHVSVVTIHGGIWFVLGHIDTYHGQDNITETVLIVEESDSILTNQHHNDLLVWQPRGIGKFDLSPVVDQSIGLQIDTKNKYPRFLRSN